MVCREAGGWWSLSGMHANSFVHFVACWALMGLVQHTGSCLVEGFGVCLSGRDDTRV